jgi:flagellar biosynthesis/type III secretory pathway protein FliH
MSQHNTPVISPADLASIIGKAQSKGFAATGHVRQSGDGAFMPSDFASRAQAASQHIEEAVEVEPRESADVHPFPEPTVVPKRDFDAELRAAREEGRLAGLAEGLARGQAEAQAHAAAARAQGIDGARDIFLQAAEALSGPDKLISAPLAFEIERAVLRLASARSGIQITSHPAPFAARIAKMADRVAQGMREVKIALHPEDHAAVAQHLAGHPLIDGGTVLADPRLSRGDVIISGPSIRMADLLLQDEGPE